MITLVIQSHSSFSFAFNSTGFS